VTKLGVVVRAAAPYVAAWLILGALFWLVVNASTFDVADPREVAAEMDRRAERAESCDDLWSEIDSMKDEVLAEWPHLVEADAYKYVGQAGLDFSQFGPFISGLYACYGGADL
jgi:hypothetical protein